MVEVWPHSPCKIWKSCPAIPMKNKLSSRDTPLGAAHAGATLLAEWHLTADGRRRLQDAWAVTSTIQWDK